MYTPTLWGDKPRLEDESAVADMVRSLGFGPSQSTSTTQFAALESTASRRIADSLLELCHVTESDPRFEPTYENLRDVLDTTTRLLKESRGRPWVYHGVTYEVEALRRQCIAYAQMGECFRRPPDVNGAEALRHFHAALAAVEKTRDRLLEAKIHRLLARQMMEDFQWQEAVESLRSCEATFVMYGRSLEACEAKIALAQCYRCLGWADRGRDILKLATAAARRNDYLQAMVDVSFETALLALTEEAGGVSVAMVEAEKCMRRAYDLTREMTAKRENNVFFFF